MITVRSAIPAAIIVARARGPSSVGNSGKPMYPQFDQAAASPAKEAFFVLFLAKNRKKPVTSNSMHRPVVMYAKNTGTLTICSDGVLAVKRNNMQGRAK